ncbi:DUF3179 domain-containing protein [bacterium]|nr:DUF3179 domain-containing protein [bacterium]
MRGIIRAIPVFPLLLHVPVAAEPEQGAENRFGRWHRADPGYFVPINEPRYRPAADVQLPGEGLVIGVTIGDQSRAYPLRLMTYHHVVNDVIADKPVAVTYCVMANSAVVYTRKTPDVQFEAGGLFGGVLALREIDTERCWAQMAHVPLPEDAPSSTTLTIAAPSVITTLDRWRAQHPDTLVLMPEPDYQIRYAAFDRRSKGFVANPLMNGSVVHHDPRLEPGVEVFGIAVGNFATAWPLDLIRKAGKVDAQIDGRTVTVRWDAALDTAVVDGPFEGFALRSFWYAWSQFYPETTLP